MYTSTVPDFIHVRYADEYLDCVEDAVTNYCGSDAGKWQRGLDNSQLAPALKYARCNDSPSE